MKAFCCIAGLLSVFLCWPDALPASEKIEIAFSKSLSLETEPLDVVASRDGRHVYVLTPGGNLQVYTGDGGFLEGVALEKTYDALRPGPFPETLVAINRKDGRIDVLRISFVKEIDTMGAPAKGPADAPVEIVVFSDFQCPYCAQTAQTLDEVTAAFDGQVREVFKHFPLKNHRFAVLAAAASLAADRQDRFWEIHDLLYQNYKDLNQQKIREIVETAGLDMARFEKDIRDPEVLAHIRRDVADGNKAGIKGVTHRVREQVGRLYQGLFVLDRVDLAPDPGPGQGL